MSKERELLKRAIYFLEPLDWAQNVSLTCQDLIKEIEELLAQPEQQPDLWVVTNPWGVMELMWSEPREQVYVNYKVTKFYRSPLKSKPLSVEESFSIPLYTAPPKREPLSAIQILEGIDIEEVPSYKALTFQKGVRWAEKQHGIGERNSHYKERHETFGEGDESDT
jgi:hypothetical protein